MEARPCLADTLPTTLTVRRATDQDDLRSFLGGDIGRHRLNYEQVFVAESARGLEGMQVMFDGEHSMIYVDHLILRPDAPSHVGPHLILAINAWCQRAGKTAIFLVTGSVELAYIGKRRGAKVEGPLFRIRYDITELEGARHA